MMGIWRNDEKFIRLQTHLLTVHAQFLTTYNVCDVDCACTSANVTTRNELISGPGKNYTSP